MLSRKPKIDALALAIMDIATIPMWVKWAESLTAKPVMLYINQTYVDWYNKAPEDYVGMIDDAVWGEEVGRMFRILDFEAMATPNKVIASTEPTPGGKYEFCEAFKIAVPHKGGFFVFGKALPYGWSIDDD